MTAPRLVVELVPATSWFENLRSLLAPADWDRLRRQTYRAARYRCEVCGGRGEAHPVECHERWVYDEVAGTQTLSGLIALCPLCHLVVHFGYARTVGRQEEAGRHLMRVNNWSRREAHGHVQAAFATFERRSGQHWRLDVSWLAGQGVEVRPPAGPDLEELSGEVLFEVLFGEEDQPVPRLSRAERRRR
ncbi:hypothetical protein LAJ19_20425 (plasmid) [Deinococcus taeanensis]|uniref:hypothetical protein n=1 Tax=Deinococcus taeanensis TaxID=2737050 RepID=UPI001CDC9A1B|nr:hypothetical protein [Deinococcus taeanensis]UBV45495.1 hypothetical protein LAJ19_20425 [Deinococcus taeanensis]